MKTFTLNPVNGRKSFGSKMFVQEDENVAKLFSYNTEVAQYDITEKKMTINGKYPPTTNTHINAFLDHYGFTTCTAKELEKYTL